MDYYLTEDMARAALPRLRAAGEVLHLPPAFTDVDRYAPGDRDDFAQFMEDWKIQHFSVREVVTPHHREKARRLGYTEFVPPMHLWAWALLVLSASDRVRDHVGRPVVMRNLYRPMPYNEAVAESGIRSDHPNAAGADLDLRSVDDRRDAETLLRSLAAAHPELEMSLGLGAQTIHLGILSPEGHRQWFYDSYPDTRTALDASPPPAPTDRSREEASSDREAAPAAPVDVPPRRGGEDDGELAVFDAEVRRRIIEQVAVHESRGEFDALNRDGEFRGLFDRAGKRHPASGHHHIGLSYGVIQFTQDSGSLGALLELMRERDPETFAEIFGRSADQLVDTVTARGPTSAQSPPRGARVQPVDGTDLWEEPWTDRFRRAGHHPPFQDAQLDLAGREYLDPMVEFCDQLGLDTDRALTIVVDRAVQMGRSGARRWIMSTVGPITELGMLAGILSAYGFSGVRDFQRAVPGVEVDGDWGPNTHAALCWFERQRADSDPFVVFVPDREMMLDMMVAASSGERWGHRVERLRTATGFQDEPLDLRG